MERGGGETLLCLSLKRSLSPAVGSASPRTLSLETAGTNLCTTKAAGRLRRNFPMPQKLVVSFLSQIIPKIEAVPASLVQEKMATMPSPLFYFIAFWNTQVTEEHGFAQDSNNTHISM